MDKAFDRRMAAYERETDRYLTWANSLSRIDIPESRKWDYAIPANYTNYRDGFLWQDENPQKGDPFMVFNGEMLYFLHEFHWLDLDLNTEKEKYIALKRNGEKVLIVIIAEQAVVKDGNPSYSDFIPLVKKYVTTKKGPGVFSKVIYKYPKELVIK